MTTQRQTAANRRNALHSTGPRTVEGKTAVRLNSLKHGLRSPELLVPGEDQGEFLAFADGVRERLAPQGELEVALMDRIVSLSWRLRRASRAEAAIVTTYMIEIGAEQANGNQNGVASVLASSDGPAPETDRTGVQQREPSPPMGVALIRDAGGSNALGKVSRYEIGLQRSFFATLRELRGLQAERNAAKSAGSGNPRENSEVTPRLMAADASR